ncbi:MAG: hypothetical protein R3316_01700 [Rhodovibrionaceae bacterium]|nr:hypothetical protein [Rhodovibrionaceae bacterium]
MTSGALSLAFDPLLPWAVLAALGVIALASVSFGMWQLAGGVWWRALMAAALWLALANPAVIEEEREYLSDIAVAVLDESPSQRIGERMDASTAALAHLRQRIEALPDTELRVVRAGAADRLDSDRGTRLFNALDRALAEIPDDRLAGAVLITDGQVHDVPEKVSRLDEGAPLHVLRSGERKSGDRRLQLSDAPGYGLVGDTVRLKLQVDDLPAEGGEAAGGQGRMASVRIARSGEDAEVRRIPVGVEQELEIEIDRRGPNIVEIEVAPGPEELSLINNRAAVEILGVRERLRVLLVSGEPHAGERAWRNLLKSDGSVDLVHFTILRPPEKQDGTPIRELSLIAFPTRELFEVKINEFDLVIFDRYRRRGVLPQLYIDNIAEYVEDGGALLEAVGPTFATPLSLFRTPLGRIMPAEPTSRIFEEGYRPEVTETGRRHPVTAALPGEGAGPDGTPAWGRWFRQIDVRARRGEVVMTGVEGQPLLVLDRFGEGRVAQLMSDHIWLWARGFEGGGPQAELMRRVAHWLMKEPELEEDQLRAVVSGNRLEIEKRSLAPIEDEMMAEVTFPDGQTANVALQPGDAGRASGGLDIDAPGLYRVRMGEDTARVAAGALSPREYADLRASDEALSPIVSATGGGLLAIADMPQPEIRKVKGSRRAHGTDWLGLRANRAYLATDTTRVPLLPAALVLLLALGGLGLAWWREGR